MYFFYLETILFFEKTPISHECKVARMDKAGSSMYCVVHIGLRAGQIGLSRPESSWTILLRTILSFIQSYKIWTLTFFQPIFDHKYLYLYVKLSLQQKYIQLFSLYDSIPFNKAKTFILYKCYFPWRNFVWYLIADCVNIMPQAYFQCHL